MPAATLSARDLVKSFGPRVVLDGVSLTVGPRHRVGVVAPNGTGKSTLLRVLAGLEVPDGGHVVVAPPRATIGYLPQEADRRAGETVRAFLARRTGVSGAEAMLDRTSMELASGAPGADDRYAAALERYLAAGAADFESRTDALAPDLGLDRRLLEAPMTALSGGQAARAALASILLARYDVFLLDEPTNDLDFAGLERLEEFLGALEGGVVVVSHDRAFLDRTITSVLELDGHSHSAALYEGGWSAYLRERATARRQAEESYAKHRARHEELTARSRRQREWADRGVRRARAGQAREADKFVRRHRKQTSEQLAARARTTDRAIARLDAEAVAKPWEGWELHLEIAAAPRAGAVVAEARGAVVHRGPFTLGPVDLRIDWGERVAIVGPNGSGKTTLLRALLGEVPLAGGECRLGPGVVLGEIGQARSRFPGDVPLVEAFAGAAGILPAETRTLLAKFGLGPEHVVRGAAGLSPGERTRAELALLQARAVNCVVLDEPTNHLDLEALEQLEAALERYPGTLVVVSHDRALLEALRLTRRIELEAGRVGADVPL